MGNDLKEVDLPFFTSKENAPRGFAPISSVWPSEGASRDRERVRRGVLERAVDAAYLAQSTKGRMELWVDVDQAKQWLAAWDDRATAIRNAARRLPSIERPSFDIERIRVYERIADSLEAIAKALVGTEQKQTDGA